MSAWNMMHGMDDNGKARPSILWQRPPHVPHQARRPKLKLRPRHRSDAPHCLQSRFPWWWWQCPPSKDHLLCLCCNFYIVAGAFCLFGQLTNFRIKVSSLTCIYLYIYSIHVWFMPYFFSCSSISSYFIVQKGSHILVFTKSTFITTSFWKKAKTQTKVTGLGIICIMMDSKIDRFASWSLYWRIAFFLDTHGYKIG
jgi:hypothetical protein